MYSKCKGGVIECIFKKGSNLVYTQITMTINHLSSRYREAAKWGETPEIQKKANRAAKSAMKGHITPVCQTAERYTLDGAEIYTSDGEMIAGYNSLGGGWTMVQTEAESRFLGEAASVYAQTFKEARTEMKGTAQTQVPQSGSSQMDIRA